MNASLRKSLAILAIGALVALTAFFSAGTVRAQPPCATLTIVNNTGCDLRIRMYAAGFSDYTFRAVPGVSVITAPVGGFPAQGVYSNAGTQIPYAPPGCTPCLTLPGWKTGVNPPCCATLCPNPATCTMTINPCGPPCIP